MRHGLADLTTRREWIVGTALLADRALAAGNDALTGGKFIGDLKFEDEGRAPLDTLVGGELDGRLYTDLSHVESDRQTTPTGQFYIRTRASRLLDVTRPWSIIVTSVTGAARIAMSELKAHAEPQGVHLLECAGNTRAAHFGMISVARWDGVPLARWLDRLRFDKSAGILISGFDEYAAKPVTPSVPGASWIFSRHDIEASRAFLATAMNGAPLTHDHGAPVRLVAPGWYGCACIKWVNEIMPVDAAAEATSQMQEYAARTNQHGIPARANEYQPAVIDPAAMPVRVEQWLVGERVKLKIVGIVWGGSRPNENLQIRFGPDEPYVPVLRVQTEGQSPWGVWTHVWTPTQPGVYRIRLRLADRSIRTRRLDAGFYVRQVRVDRV
jgi:DMSO/TMAO reductase YedYZ molybdopterin-dependent catalytic subunit